MFILEEWCRRMAILTIVTGSTLGAQVSVQQASIEAAPTRDPSALAAMDGAFGSMASLAARQNLRSVVITGAVMQSANSNTQVGTFTAKLVGSHFLLVTNIGSHQIRYSSLGRRGFVSVDGKKQALTTSGASSVGVDVFPLLEPWAAYADAINGISAAADQTIEGVACREIDIHRPLALKLIGHPTEDVRVFIDKGTGLVRAVDYPMNQTQFYSPLSRMRILYDNYQVLDGLRIPTSITRLANGRPFTILRILTVDTHQVFDDSALGQ